MENTAVSAVDALRTLEATQLRRERITNLACALMLLRLAVQIENREFAAHAVQGGAR